MAEAKKEEKNAINQIDAYETEQHIKRLINEMVALYEEYVKDNSQTKTMLIGVDLEYSTNKKEMIMTKEEEINKLAREILKILSNIGGYEQQTSKEDIDL